MGKFKRIVAVICILIAVLLTGFCFIKAGQERAGLQDVIDELRMKNDSAGAEVRRLRAEVAEMKADLEDKAAAALQYGPPEPPLQVTHSNPAESEKLAKELEDKAASIEEERKRLDTWKGELEALGAELKKKQADLAAAQKASKKAEPEKDTKQEASRRAELEALASRLKEREEELSAKAADLVKREALLRSGCDGETAASTGKALKAVKGKARAAAGARLRPSDFRGMTGFTVSSLSAKGVELTWDVVPGEIGADSFKVYREGKPGNRAKGMEYAEASLAPDTPYCYSLVAVTTGGVEMEVDKLCTRTLAKPENVPTGVPLYLNAKTVGADHAVIEWLPIMDLKGLRGVNVYEDGALLRTVRGTGDKEGTATLENLTQGTKYCYVVTAIDSSERESSQSNEVCLKTLTTDLGKPTAPSGLSSTAHASQGKVDLTWKPSKDDSGVAGYVLYREGKLINMVSGNSATDLEYKAGATQCYSVTALDPYGNESKKSPESCVLGKGSGTLVAHSTLWSEGLNEYGQLGQGKSASTLTLSAIEGVKDVTMVALGMDHALALRKDGSVWAWGRNDRGQLGLSNKDDKDAPVPVPTMTGVKAVAAGGSHSLALKADGTVWSWGRNYYGQLGDGGYFDRDTPVQVPGISDIVAIASGGYHCLALEKDGTLWAWGANHKGQLGNATRLQRNRPVKVTGISGVKLLSAGLYHTVVLKSDGTLWAWGSGEFGQLGTGEREDLDVPAPVKGMERVEQVSAGMNHTVALKSDGTVWAWGRNEYGQIGVEEGSIFTTPVKNGSVTGVKRIAAGLYHTIAVKKDGTLWGWGWRSGARFAKNEALPLRISGITGVVDVAAGRNLTIAIKSN